MIKFVKASLSGSRWSTVSSSKIIRKSHFAAKLFHSSLVLSSTFLCSNSNLFCPVSVQPPRSFVSRYFHSSQRSCSSNMTPPPSQYVIPNDQPVVTLDAKKAFDALKDQEKLYAHFLSRASFYGGLIVLLQTSPESPQIFRLLQRLVMAESPADLKKRALAAGVTEEDFKAFQVYCSGVYCNMGNYKGFGDSKMVPNVTESEVAKIIGVSAAREISPEIIDELWNDCKGPMYSLSDREKQLGLGEKGITKYLSSNIDQDDVDKINRFFKSQQIEGYINRALKSSSSDGKTVFEIRNAGVETKTVSTHEFEGATFQVTTGDYSGLMALLNLNLEHAKRHALNENESKMIESYIKSFNQGSLEAHKDGSRFWIKDKGPVVESYIGFIETYRDPVGMRGEFEGFVSMVNKEQSEKFQLLVEKAEELLPRLPWPKEYEKDTFLRPDFTSLDVLTFAGSGIPAGINIPNYDEIRQSEGFKNVNLGNVIAASYKADKKTTFVSDEDHILLKKWIVSSFEVQVGLHELLGHGSGKLLRKEADGKLNFKQDLLNPLNGKQVDKFYEAGETYDSKFTSLGSSYEECRAEAVGLYLSCSKDIVAIFGHQTDVDDLIYANWLSLCHAAVRGVEMYSPSSKEWKQAHSQARFVLLHVMLEAGEGFLTVKEIKGEDGQPDLLLSMDRSKIETVGKPAVGNFLQKLQILKSLGDFDAAKEMYDHFSEVKEEGQFPFAKWREIVLARKTPRKMLVQANTVVKDEKINLIEYESSHDGIMQSWADRFSKEEFAVVDSVLHDLYLKDKPFF